MFKHSHKKKAPRIAIKNGNEIPPLTNMFKFVYCRVNH